MFLFKKLEKASRLDTLYQAPRRAPVRGGGGAPGAPSGPGGGDAGLEIDFGDADMGTGAGVKVGDAGLLTSIFDAFTAPDMAETGAKETAKGAGPGGAAPAAEAPGKKGDAGRAPKAKAKAKGAAAVAATEAVAVAEDLAPAGGGGGAARARGKDDAKGGEEPTLEEDSEQQKQQQRRQHSGERAGERTGAGGPALETASNDLWGNGDDGFWGEAEIGSLGDYEHEAIVAPAITAQKRATAEGHGAGDKAAPGKTAAASPSTSASIEGSIGEGGHGQGAPRPPAAPPLPARGKFDEKTTRPEVTVKARAQAELAAPMVDLDGLTGGIGTDEDAVLAALESDGLDAETRAALADELSGEDLAAVEEARAGGGGGGGGGGAEAATETVTEAATEAATEAETETEAEAEAETEAEAGGEAVAEGASELEAALGGVAKAAARGAVAAAFPAGADEAVMVSGTGRAGGGVADVVQAAGAGGAVAMAGEIAAAQVAVPEVAAQPIPEVGAGEEVVSQALEGLAPPPRAQRAPGAEEDPGSEAQQRMAELQARADWKKVEVEEKQTAKATQLGGVVDAKAVQIDAQAVSTAAGVGAEAQKAQQTAVKEVEQKKAASSIEELRAELAASLEREREELATGNETAKEEVHGQFETKRQTLTDEASNQEQKIAGDLTSKLAEIDSQIAGKGTELETHITEQMELIASQGETEKSDNTARAETRSGEVTATGETDAGEALRLGYEEADNLKQQATDEASEARAKGETAAQEARDAAASASAARDAEREDDGLFGSIGNAIGDLFSSDPEEDGEEKAQLAIEAAEETAKEIEERGETAYQKARLDAENAAEGIRSEAKTKADGIVKEGEQANVDVDAKVEASRAQQEADRATGLAQMEAEKAQLIEEANAAAETARSQSAEDVAEGTARLDEEEAETRANLDAELPAKLAEVEKKGAAAEKQLEAGKGKDLAQLQKVLDKSLADIDKASVEAEKKCEQIAAAAQKQAAVEVTKQLAKIEANGEAALASIDAAVKQAKAHIEADAQLAHRQLDIDGRDGLSAVEKAGEDARAKIDADALKAEADVHAKKDKSMAKLYEASNGARDAMHQMNVDLDTELEDIKTLDLEKTHEAAEDLEEAMEGWGTDEAAINKALEGRSPAEIRAIKKKYKEKTGQDLDADLRDELSDTELKLTKAVVSNDPVAIASAELENAADGGLLGGTDEDQINETLGRITDPEMRAAVAKKFQKDSGMRLSSMLKDELSGEELAESQALLGEVEEKVGPTVAPEELAKVTGNPKTMKALDQAAADLFKAMDGGGTTEDAIHTALKGKSPAEIRALMDIYKDHYEVDLIDRLEEEMSGTDLKEATAALSGDPVQAAVAALENAKSGAGTDEKKIFDTLEGITDPEVRRQVVEEYEKETGEKLKDMMADEMSDNDKDLGEALLIADNKERAIKAGAIKLDEAADGIGTDNDAIYDVLEKCKTKEEREAVAREFEKRNPGMSLEAMLKDELSGPELDVAEKLNDGDKAGAAAARIAVARDSMWGTDEKGIFKQLEGKTDPKERQAIIDAYNAQYGAGRGGMDFDQMLTDEMSGMDLQKANYLADSGTTPPAFEIAYALDGPGTDEDTLRKSLDGKTAKQIDDLRKQYNQMYPDKNFDSDIMGEVSGRDSFEVGLMLEGEPQDPAGKLERAKKKYDYERGDGAGIFGNTFTDVFSDSGEVLDRQHEKLMVLESKLKAQGAIDTDENGNLINTGELDPKQQAELDKYYDWTGLDVKNYQAAKDSVTNALAQGATIVVGGAVSILTAGAASPAVVAALAALAGGAAGMLVKAGMQGDSYGVEDMGIDAVKAIASAATGGLMKADFVTGPIGKLATYMAGSNQGMLFSAFQGGISGLASGALGGVTDGLTNEDAWRDGGDMLQGLVTGAGKGAASGLVGGVFGAVANSPTSGVTGKMLGDPKTYLEAARKGLITGAAGAIVPMAVSGLWEPGIYEGRIEDVLGNFGKAGLTGAASGMLDSMGDFRADSIKAAKAAKTEGGGGVKSDSGEAHAPAAETDEAPAAKLEEAVVPKVEEVAAKVDEVVEPLAQEAPAAATSPDKAPEVEQAVAPKIEEVVAKVEETAAVPVSDEQPSPATPKAEEIAAAVDQTVAPVADEASVPATAQEAAAPEVADPATAKQVEEAVAAKVQEEAAPAVEEAAKAKLEETPERPAELAAAEAANDNDGPAAKAGEAEVEPLTPATADAETAALGQEMGAAGGTAAGGPEVARPVENSPVIEARAEAQLAKLSPQEQGDFKSMMSGADNDAAKVILERAMAAGNSMADISTLATALKGKSADQIMAHFTGAGLTQAFTWSCVPTSFEIAIAELNPVFAMQMKGDTFVQMDMQAAALAEHGNTPVPRSDLPPTQAETAAAIAEINAPASGPESGLSGLDKPTALSDALAAAGGAEYRARVLDSAHPTLGVSHDNIQAALIQGYPVMVGQDQHCQVIVGTAYDATGGQGYVIQDPATGKTTVVPIGEIDTKAQIRLPDVDGTANNTTAAAPAGALPQAAETVALAKPLGSDVDVDVDAPAVKATADDFAELAAEGIEAHVEAQQDAEHKPFYEAMKHADTPEAQQVMATIGDKGVEVSSGPSTAFTDEFGTPQITVNAQGKTGADVMASVVHEGTHADNSPHEHDVSVQTRDDYRAGVAHDEAVANAAEIVQHLQANAAAKARGEQYDGTPHPETMEAYAKGYVEGLAAARANGLDPELAREYARAVGTAEIEKIALDLTPNTATGGTYRDEADAQWAQANPGRDPHEQRAADPVLDPVSDRVQQTMAEIDAMERYAPSADHPVEVDQSQFADFDRRLAESEANAALARPMGAAEAPDVEAAPPQVSATTDEVLDAAGVGTGPFDPARANEVMAEVVEADPKMTNRGFGSDNSNLSSPEALEAQLKRAGMSPEEVAERMATERSVFASRDEGTVKPYEGKQGDRVGSYRVDGSTDAEPTFRVATGERTIMVVPAGVDPTFVSTDFYGCGATVVYGVDADGRQVILTGHVFHDDPKGHFARLQTDIADLSARGITDLRVVVVPGNDPNLPEGARIPAPEALAAHFGDQAQVHVMDRGAGTDDATHIVATREGVGVFNGGVGDDMRPVASFDLKTGRVIPAGEEGHGNARVAPDLSADDLRALSGEPEQTASTDEKLRVARPEDEKLRVAAAAGEPDVDAAGELELLAEHQEETPAKRTLAVPGEATAGMVPGVFPGETTFAGDLREQAPPLTKEAVHAVLDSKLEKIAPKGVTPAGGGVFDVETKGGPVAVAVKVADAPFPDGAVARIVPDGPDYIIELSPGADDTHVARALAHELEEIRSRETIHEWTPDTERSAGMLQSGQDTGELTHHDRGRVAELRVMLDELAAGGGGADRTPEQRQAERRLYQEIDALASHLGLNDAGGSQTTGTPEEARARREARMEKVKELLASDDFGGRPELAELLHQMQRIDPDHGGEAGVRVRVQDTSPAGGGVAPGHIMATSGETHSSFVGQGGGFVAFDDTRTQAFPNGPELPHGALKGDHVSEAQDKYPKQSQHADHTFDPAFIDEPSFKAAVEAVERTAQEQQAYVLRTSSTDEVGPMIQTKHGDVPVVPTADGNTVQAQNCVTDLVKKLAVAGVLTVDDFRMLNMNDDGTFKEGHDLRPQDLLQHLRWRELEWQNGQGGTP